MKARLYKEFRLLAPAWGGALLLAAVTPQVLWDLSFVALGLGLVVLAVSSLGREFSSRTFSLLLTQPLTRTRLWTEKASVLAAAFGVVGLVFWLSRSVEMDNPFANNLDAPSGGLITALMLAVAFSGGLWTALLFRQITPALAFTALTPVALLAVTVSLVSRFRLGSEEAMATWVLSLYAILGLAGSWWLLARAQDVQWLGEEITLPWWPRRQAQENTPGAASGRGSPLAALIAKELRLQQINALCAVVFPVLSLGVAALGAYLGEDKGETAFGIAAGIAWLMCLILPLLVGAVAIAEERKLGTFDAHQCLPVSRGRQFLTKLLTAGGAGVVLGGALPWMLFKLLGALTKQSVFAEAVESPWLLCLAFPLGVTTLAFYGSSLARNTLQALGLAVVLLVATLLAATFLSNPETLLGQPLWRGPLGLCIAAPATVLVLWRLAFANYLALDDDWPLRWKNLGALLGTALLVCVFTALVYARVWDKWLPGEPAHGPARIGSAESPLLATEFNRAVFGVLPDGRLWMLSLPEAGQGVDAPLRSRGRPVEFLPGSNWLVVASTAFQTVGLRADGTLWEFLAAGGARLQDRQIGTHADWQTVAAGAAHFLALKRDGSLWAWGEDTFGVLGLSGEKSAMPAMQRRFGILPTAEAAPIPAKPAATPTNEPTPLAESQRYAVAPGRRVFRSEPARVGEDNDWIRIFPTRFESFALKRDGSLWHWGRVIHEVRNQRVVFAEARQPQRLGRAFDLPWRAIADDGYGTFAIHPDGTLWAWNLVHEDNASASPSTQKPVRLDARSAWRAITSDGRGLLRQDGTLWENLWATPWGRRSGGGVKPLSAHADWCAISSRGDLLALAADGGLISWEPRAAGWLAPNVQPWRVGNVFTAEDRTR